MTDSIVVSNLENGSITITDSVFRAIANIASEEVAGVNSLSGGISGDIVEIFTKKNHTKGVKIDYIEDKLNINISVIVEFGIDIKELATGIQKSVKNKVETMTDVKVENVNIEIVGVKNKVKVKKEDCAND